MNVMRARKILLTLPFLSKMQPTPYKKAHLHDILPPLNTIIGVPFVTRLIRTNIDTCEMVRYLNVRLQYLIFFLVCFPYHVAVVWQ
jgi:hypothetical protein